MIEPTQAQIDALYAILRADADKSGYGWAISDDVLKAMAQAGALAVVNAK